MKISENVFVHWNPLGSSGFQWVPLGSTGFQWVLRLSSHLCSRSEQWVQIFSPGCRRCLEHRDLSETHSERSGINRRVNNSEVGSSCRKFVELRPQARWCHIRSVLIRLDQDVDIWTPEKTSTTKRKTERVGGITNAVRRRDEAAATT